MYLYFDKTGVLREIINDEALRQGNYGVNTIYVYVDDKNYDSIDASFLLPSGAVVGPYHCDSFVEAMVPYNAKRDLRFFRYGKNYRFCRIPLDNAPNAQDTPELHNPLEEAGAVHASLAMIIDGYQDVLGEVNFYVETSAALNQPQVAPEQYLSLANYEFLRKLVQNVGASILTGSGEPQTNIGNNGDIYLDTNDYDLYKKALDVWSLIGNLQGPEGPEGPDGPEGPVGPAGPAAGFGELYTQVITLPPGSPAGASVRASELSPNTAKVFYFTFGIPRGADGVVAESQGVIGFYVNQSGQLVANAPGNEDPSSYLSINSSGQLVYTY